MRHLLGVTLALACSTLKAAGWEVKPSLTVEEHYTDNVFASTSYVEDFFTVFNPALIINRTGTLIDIESSASLQKYIYKNTGRFDTTAKDFYILGHLGADEYPLGLDGSFRDHERIRTYTGSVSATRILTDNQDEERAYYASPYLKLKLGDIWNSELRAYKRAIRYDERTELNQDKDGVSFRLSPQKTHAGAFFGLRYQQIRENYVSFSDYVNDHEIASAYVGMRFLPAIAIYYEHGYERNEYSLIDQKLSGSLRFLVAEWGITENSHLKIQAGDRFYGDSYGVELTSRSKWYDLALHYKEQTSSEQVEATQGDRVFDELRFYLPVRSELYIDKEFGFNARFTMNRIAIDLRGLRNIRDFKFSDTLGKTYEAKSQIRFMLDQRTDMDFGYQKIWISDEKIQRIDSFDEFTWSMQRRLKENISGAININKLYRNTNGTSSDHSELEVAAMVKVGF